MTRISISICPTDLEFSNGDTYCPDRLTSAIIAHALRAYPGARVAVQIGYAQGDAWSFVDGDECLGAELLSSFWDRHAGDDDLFVEVEDDAIEATWSEDSCSYLAESEDWTSADGNDWIDSSGQPVQGDQFDRVTIRLVGGPRNGEVVA